VSAADVKGGAELKDVLAELETLMGSLRVNVDTLQAILTEPEVPDDARA
jgi:hypothetical protein